MGILVNTVKYLFLGSVLAILAIFKYLSEYILDGTAKWRDMDPVQHLDGTW